MDQPVRFVLAIMVPVLLVLVNLWLWFRVRPRRRREMAEHPERRPYGWNLALRYTPFVIIGVACAIDLGTKESPLWYLLAIGMLVFFAWDLKKRWRRPAER